LDLQKSACLADDGYVPNLWYCDLLSFNAIWNTDEANQISIPMKR
jgi:hypothetical protein